jgi:hypothetical protein
MDTLITQIVQVISEICDMKEGHKIQGNNKYYNGNKYLEPTDLTAQMEHNRHPRRDTGDKGVPCDDETSNNKLCPPHPTYTHDTPTHYGTPLPQMSLWSIF